jgi:hypothetical protein
MRINAITTPFTGKYSTVTYKPDGRIEYRTGDSRDKLKLKWKGTEDELRLAQSKGKVPSIVKPMDELECDISDEQIERAVEAMREKLIEAGVLKK